MVSKMEGLLFLILQETIFVIEPGVAGWRLKPARRGDGRPGGAGAAIRGRLPPFVSGSFFHFFLNKGCQKGVYNCIFQAVPNDTFKYAHLQKRLILCKLI